MLILSITIRFWLLIKVCCFSKQGGVISVCDDVSHDSIHLWEINKKDGKAILEEVKTCTLQGRWVFLVYCQ